MAIVYIATNGDVQTLRAYADDIDYVRDSLSEGVVEVSDLAGDSQAANAELLGYLSLLQQAIEGFYADALVMCNCPEKVVVMRFTLTQGVKTGIADVGKVAAAQFSSSEVLCVRLTSLGVALRCLAQWFEEVQRALVQVANAN